MKKIITIGCPGSGKSTFARRLREKTGIKLYHLDMIWHKPDKTNITKEEFNDKLNKILCHDKWIIDGNYQETLEFRLKNCDTVFFLDFPTEVCISGAKSRIGKKREDMPWVETEFDDEFFNMILNFKKERVPEIYELLKKYDCKNIIVFKNRNDIEEFFKNFSP